MLLYSARALAVSQAVPTPPPTPTESAARLSRPQSTPALRWRVSSGAHLRTTRPASPALPGLHCAICDVQVLQVVPAALPAHRAGAQCRMMLVGAMGRHTEPSSAVAAAAGAQRKAAHQGACAHGAPMRMVPLWRACAGLWGPLIMCTGLYLVSVAYDRYEGWFVQNVPKSFRFLKWGSRQTSVFDHVERQLAL